MSCGHTQVSPSSSKIQLPFSQLQHSFFTRVFTLRLCRGVSRLIPVILHQQDKRKALPDKSVQGQGEAGHEEEGGHCLQGTGVRDAEGDQAG